jgi:hypothetical protein
MSSMETRCVVSLTEFSRGLYFALLQVEKMR